MKRISRFALVIFFLAGIGSPCAAWADTDWIENIDTGNEYRLIKYCNSWTECEAEAEAQVIHDSTTGAGCTRYPCAGSGEFAFVLDEEGRVIDVVLGDGGAIDEDIKACYLAAVEGQTFPCLREHGDIWLNCAVLLA